MQQVHQSKRSTIRVHNITRNTTHNHTNSSPAVHDFRDPVHEYQHIVGQFLVYVLEVVNVAEPENRIYPHACGGKSGGIVMVVKEVMMCGKER